MVRRHVEKLIIAGACFALGWAVKPKQVEIITETKTVEVPAYEESTLPNPVVINYLNVPITGNMQKYIAEICADNDVPPSLVYAMIDEESGFDADCVSDTNDYGLMQINSINRDQLADEYHAADLLNPYQNVYCGVKIISSYIEKYGDYNKALMAYNMGEYGAEKAWEDGVKVSKYSEQILALMKNYEEELNVNEDQ
ncbi:MAG: transglycosylase SLT domain-containing protein [Firmicutes bacterium]|nr:transglycosylase SLT domain-containing protein [Bacillota bacterium]